MFFYQKNKIRKGLSPDELLSIDLFEKSSSTTLVTPSRDSQMRTEVGASTSNDFKSSSITLSTLNRSSQMRTEERAYSSNDSIHKIIILNHSLQHLSP